MSAADARSVCTNHCACCIGVSFHVAFADRGDRCLQAGTTEARRGTNQPKCEMLTGEMSSKSRAPIVRRPSIDDLAAIARAAGKTNANRHTIRHWVSQKLLDRPLRVGRDYRYPLRAVGQVDTLARWSIRSTGLSMVRFALFVEAESIAPAEALAIVAERTELWRTSVARARSEARDPELLRREAEKAARLRGHNSVLPRQVRMPLDERVAAVAQLVALMLNARVAGVPSGMASLERALGVVPE